MSSPDASQQSPNQQAAGVQPLRKQVAQAPLWQRIFLGIVFGGAALSFVLKMTLHDARVSDTSSPTSVPSALANNTAFQSTAVPSPPVDKINETGFSMITDSPAGFSQMYDRIENMKVLERIDKTAGALNYPAHIIGYSFDGLSSVTGKNIVTIFIGFVTNTDKNTYQCIHWDKEKTRVLEEGWEGCGGLK